MLETQRRELWGAVLDGRYRLLRPLGAGATGVVFAAVDVEGRELAIKLLSTAYADDAELASRLRREAQVSCEVRHPGVVETLGQGVLHDGSPYVVFERIRGDSLLGLMRRWGRLSVGETLVVAQRLARILAAVHAAGYVHRDVKPEHVMLCSDTPQLSVRLLDFGVCLPRDEEPSRRARLTIYGTPGYASPEQAAAEPVDARSDLFSVGATLFEALTGRAPFPGNNPAAILARTLREEAPPVSRLRPDCPRAVESLINQLLARDREQRPASARTLARDLSRISDTSLELEASSLLAKLRSGPLRQTAPIGDEQVPTRRINAAC